MSSHKHAVTDPHHPQWNHGRIRSNMGKERVGYLIMALLWNALAQPVFWLNALNNADVEGWKLLLIALFPLVGLWLAWLAVVKWLQWKRFGNLELEMDPFPASQGGDAGGTIELPLAYRAGKTIDVTLSCVSVRISRGGKNNSRHETVLWRERANVAVEPGMRGSRVRFRFALPDDLPTTTEPSDNYTMWVVHLHRKLPGADLDQAFELPVLESDEPLQSRSIRHYSNEAVSSDDVTTDNVVMKHSTDGLVLHYPASRGRGMGIMVLVFGLIFCLFPGFLIFNGSDFSGGDAFSLVFFAFGAFFVMVFGVIALFMISFGIYTLFNRLDVTVNTDGILSTRRFLGLRFDRSLSRADIQQLRYKINAQQGQGARAVVHYLLEAVSLSGKPVCLGDGIKGRPLAQKLMQELGSALQIDSWQESARRSLHTRTQKQP